MPNRRYRWNTGFFRAIETEAQAYWLGFLAADGCVQDRGQIMLRLADRDGEHLQTFLNALESTHPVHRYRRSGSCYAGGVDAGVYLWSHEAVADLSRHGVTPRKTRTLRWPVTVPASLLRHYLRGYFDGDGSFSLGYIRWQTPSSLQWSVVGTVPFLEACRAYLHETVGMSLNRLQFKRPTDPYAQLFYTGRKVVARLWHHMYDDATVWLPRKREKVAPYVLMPDPVRRLTESEAAALAVRYEAGESLMTLNRTAPVGIWAITEVLRRQGVTIRPPRGTTTPDQRPALIARYAAGESPTSLGREYGITKQAVIQMATRAGVRRRRPRPG